MVPRGKKEGNSKLLNIRKIINDGLLYHEYQPLFNINNNAIFAYEALMRTTPQIDPLMLIKRAREEGVLYELDTTSINNAVKEYPKDYLEKNYFLFINILPSSIIHSNFEKFINKLLDQNPNLLGRVVFEISEDLLEQHIWRQSIFLHRLAFLKSLNFGIAFDDVSMSRATLEKVELLAPDFIKLDHHNSKNLTYSPVQQQLISFFLEYTNEKMKLVLEGIEAKEDLLTAKKLGVNLVQGYYISKPKRLKQQKINM
ncbi:MAG: EAL domain-containing protein [Lysinibacillus sp.]|nr:EAL domain-containing protein [Lysinibacillus sp.]